MTELTLKPDNLASPKRGIRNMIANLTAIHAAAAEGLVSFRPTARTRELDKAQEFFDIAAVDSGLTGIVSGFHGADYR